MYVLKFLPASKMTRKLKKSEKIFFLLEIVLFLPESELYMFSAFF